MASDLRDKLASEVLATPASDLLPHFARGALLLLAPALDLLACAEAIARDQRSEVEAWLAAGALRRASDDDGRALADGPAVRYQFLIVQPWVLAQRLPDRGSEA